MKNIKILILFILLNFTHGAFSQESLQSQRGVKNKTMRYIENQNVREVKLYDNSYALVIGMSEYKYWGRLRGPIDDIAEVSTVLSEHGFQVEIEKDLTGEQLELVISRFIKRYGLDGNNRLIVYFAGHGATLTGTDYRDIGYIVPIDAPLPERNEREFKQTALSMQRIESFAKEIQTKHALFIFDSCFSGQLLTFRDGRIIPSYIGEFLNNPVRQFISSGSSNQKVPDDSKFRRYFVSGLRGDGDVNKDGYITGSELAKYLFEKVTNDTSRYQTPQYGIIQHANLTRGDMIFFLTQSENNLSEEDAWLEAKSKNTYQNYMIFINSFRESKYFQEAIQSLVEISKLNSQKKDNELPKIETVRGSKLHPTPFEFTTLKINDNGTDTEKTNISAEDAIEEDLGEGVRLKLVRIPAGKFKMGSQKNPDEMPVREVNINEFYMGTYEITLKQWETVSKMGKINVDLPKNPSITISGDKFPAVGITWEEAKEFCERLSRYTGRIYTLPSEAEWEYAARAETDTTFYFGNKIKAEIVNFNASVDSKDSIKGVRRNQLIEVGSLGVANKYGLFDMHGNAAEWCEDGWENSYEKAPIDGSARLGSQNNKVIRGGSYALIAGRLCSTCRSFESKVIGSEYVGFRIVMRSPVIR